MADRIKVYEEKKKGTSVWAWLLPLLLVLALLAFFLLRHRGPGTSTQAGSASVLPTLGTVHFDTDSEALTNDDQTTLDRAAEALKNNPNAHMRIEGFTDSTGSDTHNLSLSERRAIAVGTYLQNKGVSRSRLTGDGFGASNPADTNSTQAGKADNRRVELYSQP